MARARAGKIKWAVTKPIIKVLLADDYPGVREAFRSLLGTHEDIYVVAEAVDGQDAVEAALRRALYDDQLVNRAAEENWATAEARLDCRRLAPKAVAMYRHVTVT